MSDYLINKEIPYFGEEGLTCAQSTLRLLIERGVIDIPMESVKMMNYLHGNLKPEAKCGAINAGAAAIGSVFGAWDVGQNSYNGYAVVEKLLTEFTEKFGTLKCEELVGKTLEERVDGQWTCAGYVLWVADKVEELISEEKARLEAEK